MLDIEIAAVDAMQMRAAGRDPLSLALMDARNHTLRWAAVFESALGAGLPLPEATLQRAPGLAAPAWLLGRVGWYPEHWIARNVQRGRGLACDASQPRLASILPGADAWFGATPAADGPTPPFPDVQTLRQYAVDTLETTLDLLANAAEDDASLYFYRLALFHEERLAEQWAVLAQELGVEAGPVRQLATHAPRQPLLMPATRWPLGLPRSGFAFDNETEVHEVAVPEFEIDAQAVTWAQFCEFVEDGGYDEAGHWNPEGWAWVQAQGRRTPRHVDQMRHGVLQHRFGRLMRVPTNQPAAHLAWFEADAWCRWAGRRLPTEVEWEAAAHQAATRGFRWGEVWEWTASTFRPYPGFVAGPDASLSVPLFGTHKVLRGASFATRGSLRSAKFRLAGRPSEDVGFFGFRSCTA